ncbi:MAG: hypothetical protein JWN15_3614 [Firmicutes bacterium]|nr:hypothetical protein [Bacillota bacterium]
MTAGTPKQPQRYTALVVGLSIAVNVLVAVLFFLPGKRGVGNLDLTFLPMLNAVLNSLTFIFLLSALAAIKRRDIQTHRRFILSAFTSTTLFLLSYVTYHALAASTKYGGAGPMRSLYFFFLITHIVLAVVIVPLALFSLVSGLSMQTARHRKFVRWTMPLWLYVSATGVVVYLMIRPFY